MLYIVVLLFLPPIIYSLYPNFGYTIKRTPRMPIKKTCHKNITRQDICLKSKREICPISSYSQCTNNQYPISKCNCFERSYELCPKTEHYDENCFKTILDKNPDVKVNLKLSGMKNRVNIVNSMPSEFNILK